ncbi:MAG: fibronectin type III domain-containing protein [Nitrosotalea sp.]
MPKTVLAVSIIALLLLGSTLAANEAFASKDPRVIDTHPPIHVKRSGTASPTGLSPLQIEHAYGFDQLSCFGTKSCGSGQTIAIVDAYDDPNIESDLAAFDSQYGLPACTTANGCFTKDTPQGLPRGNTGWALEESLDVEWAHTVAPGAKIILVEAPNSYLSSLFSAIDYAASQPNVHQVSMSWGGSEFSGENAYDYHFNVPGVSFTASAGDSGTGIEYPAASPYVVSVGGTTLNVDGSGNVQSETAWSGSGGGVSSYETTPTYQNGFNSNSGRGVPDVSYDADPNTGVPVYDSYGYSGWTQVGGTSVGAPQWAASVAIANSQRTTPLSSGSVLNTNLYGAAGGTSYNPSNTNFRDIVSGTNGNCGAICTATQGYDFITGLGSPLSNSLVPYLSPPPTPDFTISSSPSSLTINPGSSGSTTVTISQLNGFTDTVSLTASSGLGTSLTPTTISGGAGTSQLSITVPANTAGGTYQVTVTGTDTSSSLSHSTTVTVTVPTVPSAPQSLVATAGDTQVTLTWNVPSSNGGSPITGYDVYLNGTGIATNVASTSYTDTGLVNGDTNTYQVTAVNAVGESQPSNSASATPGVTPTLNVAVTTNQPSYTKNSFAQITITVTSNSSPVSGASVSLNVCAPNNGGCSTGTGTTGSNGQVTFQDKIMPHASKGTYTATAQASAAGYISGSGSATFVVN